jgi:hypothetical protein
MCESDTNEFLRGLTAAYTEANADEAYGKKVEYLLRQSLLESSIYAEAREQGEGHIKGRVTNAEIASMIRRYLKPMERELACKAGYIEGYIRAHPRPDKESLYMDAEWMYLSLRLPDRP